MRYDVRFLVTACLVALLVPVAAVAKDAKIEGPAALAGAGFFGGEVEMASADGQRPLKISGRAGYVGFLDLAGDLKVRCAGNGRVQKKETEQGVAYLCKGRGGHAFARGSHFKLRGKALRYRVLVPAGATVAFHGRFVQCVKADEGWQCERPQRPERPAAEPKRERPAGKAQPKPRDERPVRPAPDPAGEPSEDEGDEGDEDDEDDEGDEGDEEQDG